MSLKSREEIEFQLPFANLMEKYLIFVLTFLASKIKKRTMKQKNSSYLFLDV
jgi:hypothetical protein